jgi:hypothetical protein
MVLWFQQRVVWQQRGSRQASPCRLAGGGQIRPPITLLRAPGEHDGQHPGDDRVPVRLRIVPGQAPPARAALTRTVVGDRATRFHRLALASRPRVAGLTPTRLAARRSPPPRRRTGGITRRRLRTVARSTPRLLLQPFILSPQPANLLPPASPTAPAGAGSTAEHWAVCAASLQGHSQGWDRPAVQNS